MAVPPRVVLERADVASSRRIPFDRELRRYLRTVLRLEPGTAVHVLDGRGLVYDATVAEDALEIAGPAADANGTALAGPAPVRIEVMQALPKGDRFSEVVRRCTELGAARFVPVVTRHQVGGGGRVERWRKIAREAARQCRRRDVPEVLDPLPFAAAIAAAEGPLKLLFHEKARAGGRGLRDALAPASALAPAAAPAAASASAIPAGVTLAVGPEGGFSAAEVDAAAAAGFEVVAFGPRVLRTETVALAACAVLQHLWGDLG